MDLSSSVTSSSGLLGGGGGGGDDGGGLSSLRSHMSFHYNAGGRWSAVALLRLSVHSAVD